MRCDRNQEPGGRGPGRAGEKWPTMKEQIGWRETQRDSEREGGESKKAAQCYASDQSEEKYRYRLQ